MAKKKSGKKNNANNQQLLSPIEFLKQKVRTLEIGQCYVSENVDRLGAGHVFVPRLHKGGKVTVGVYFVDKNCLGVSDTFYRLRLDDYEYEDLLYVSKKKAKLREASYNEAHNLIYGAVAFAEEAGIEPYRDFSLTQYILEEDTDDVPLIEYEFGRNGKHFLVARSNLEASKYLPILEKNLGDNFEWTIVAEPEDDHYDEEDEDYFDEYDEYDDEEDFIMQTEYTYKHPEYPKTCVLENQMLMDILSQYTTDCITDEQIDSILALPHDSVRRDLEHIILYCMGLTCDEQPDSYEDEYNELMLNAIILLGEVGNSDSSLDVILEVLRQDDYFADFHFGDFRGVILNPTIYKLANSRLDKLAAFLKEEGLDTYNKVTVLEVLSLVARIDKDKRSEVTEIFRDVIRFFIDNNSTTKYSDGELNDFLVSELANNNMVELLPEIKELFNTGNVASYICGDYKSVEKDIKRKSMPVTIHAMEIHKHYAEIRRKFR